MDVNVHMEQLKIGTNVNVYIHVNVEVHNIDNTIWFILITMQLDDFLLSFIYHKMHVNKTLHVYVNNMLATCSTKCQHEKILIDSFFRNIFSFTICTKFYYSSEINFR